MAPRRGGGSSSWGGSSSSSCGACNKPLYLRGFDWKNTRVNALFALHIITLFVLVACLVLSRRFKWERQVGTDGLRHRGYVIATLSAFIYYAISVSETVLYETSTVTTYSYEIVTIFAYLFAKLLELIALGIILRTLCEDTRSSLVRRLAGLHVTVLMILGFLAATVWAFTIYQVSQLLQYGSYWASTRYRLDMTYIQLSYQALFFLVALYVCAVSIFNLIRERSKTTFIMAAVIVPALFLRTLVALINYSVAVPPSRRNINIGYAAAFSEVLTTMAIFLGLAIMGRLHPTPKFVSQQQAAGYNQQYTQQYTQHYT